MPHACLMDLCHIHTSCMSCFSASEVLKLLDLSKAEKLYIFISIQLGYEKLWNNRRSPSRLPVKRVLLYAQ